MGPFENQLALGGPEVIQEPSRTVKTTIVSEMTEGPEVIAELPQIDPTSAWKIFANGAKNSLGARAGIVLKSPKGAIFEQCLKLNFLVTNNEAEYEAFIAGLTSASKLKIPELHIFSDSKLVVNQVTEKFEAQRAKMVKYLAMVKNLLTKFRVIKIEQVGRDLNSHADALVGLASIF